MSQPSLLPLLMATPSQAMDDYRPVGRSRISCVKDAVINALSTIDILNRDATEENKIQVKIVLVDTNLRELTGSISSLKRQMESVYADHGTNLINIITHALQTWDTTPVEKRDKNVGMVFTDGFHNRKEEMQLPETKELITRLSKTQTICAYMGIGSARCVDHDTLTRLSQEQPGSYTNALTASDVTNTIQARCFEMLTARQTKDVVIRLICKTGTVIPDAVVNGYLSQDEFKALPELTPTKLATYDQKEDVCLIVPCVSSDVSHAANGQVLTMYVDTSGSMAEPVENIYEQPVTIADTSKSTDGEWVDLTLPVSSWTSTSHLFMKAHVGRVSIEYTDTVGVRHYESIPQAKSDDMDHVEKIVNMMNWLNTPVSIRDVRAYYKANMCILHDMLSCKSWIKAQMKAVWTKVKERYKRVGPSTAALTMPKGDAFFEASPVTLLELARTASSTASSPSADGKLGYDAAPQDDWDKCKICFVQNASVVFTACGHAVTCMDCYKEHLNKGGKSECIICRHAVDDYAIMNHSTGMTCKTCDAPGSYIGHCGHMQFCCSCVPKEKRVVCKMCPESTEVILVRVFL